MSDSKHRLVSRQTRFSAVGDFFYWQMPRKECVNNVTYVPPESEVIKDYGYRLCAILGQGNPRFEELEIRSGFIAFLSLVAQLQAKHLNQGQKEFLLSGYQEKMKQLSGGHHVSKDWKNDKTA